MKNWFQYATCAISISGLLLLLSCSSDNGTSGPANAGTPPVIQLGNATNGQQVFRFETFGNEGFWANAVRLQQGMMDKKLTPLQALKLGMSFDSDAIDTSSTQTLAAQLKSDPSGQNSALLNDPKFMIALFNENAVLGSCEGQHTLGAFGHHARLAGRRELRAVPLQHRWVDVQFAERGRHWASAGR